MCVGGEKVLKAIVLSPPQHIFTMEKEEYHREGINMAEVKFQDNKPLLVGTS